jgi:hypothetical protein
MSAPIVTVHVWGLRARRLPLALGQMARGNRSIRRQPGITFAKQLGTGGDRFTVTDPDPRHWALLCVWDDAARAADADELAAVRRWDQIADERWRADLSPLSSHGRWSKQEPFGTLATPAKHEGPVAAITRARLRPRKALTFWRAVPPVATSLRGSPGLLTAFGVGEAPIGLQGTFSIWESAQALRAYAYDGPEHQRAIERTEREGWYGEELFARLAVLKTAGTLHGRTLDLSP